MHEYGDTSCPLKLYLGTEVYRKAQEVAERCYVADSTVFLRSLDGIHLASAMVGGCSQLVTEDRRMKKQRHW